MSKYGKRAKEYLESKEQEKIKSSLSKDNLLSRSGLAHEHMGGRQDGYTSLYKTWDDLYKRAIDYYNNEDGYTSFYDAYSGTRSKQGYVGKNDAGRWYNDLEKQKNTANEGIEELLAELDQYSRYYNEDAVNYVRDLITQRQKSYDDVMTDAEKFRDHWSQWATEDDYNNAVWESDFYSKLQDGDFDGAEKMYREKSDLFAKNPTDNSKLSEYGEYLVAAKNNALVKEYEKYNNMSADELLGAKKELEKSLPSTWFNADPMTSDAAKNAGLMLELQYVNQLYEETAQREKYASYDVEAGQAEIDFLQGYATRAQEIKSQMIEIDGQINQGRVKGKNVDALLSQKMQLQMSLYQLSEEYRDATMSSVERNHAKVTEQSNSKYGIDISVTDHTNVVDYTDVVDFDALLSQATADHNTAVRNRQNVLMATEPLDDPQVQDSWFSASALWDDGYQPFDIIKTIGATGQDIIEDIGSGFIGIGETALDALLWLGAAMNQGTMSQAAQDEMIYNAVKSLVTGEEMENGLDTLSRYQVYQDQVERGTEDFIKQNLYDEEAISHTIFSEHNPISYDRVFGRDAEADSVSGAKLDSIAQSGGQMLGTTALQAVGVPWYVTTFATSFGSEAENALNNGATFSEAGLSATISASAEVLTEKIGGIHYKGSALSDLAVKKFSSVCANKIAQFVLDAGLDIVGEGLEEVISGYASAVGQKLTYMSDAELNELFSSEDALDAFIGGAIMGGVSSVGDAVKMFKNKDTTSIELGTPDSYAYDMSTVIQEYLDGVNNDVLEYANECRADKNTPYKRMKISDVGIKQAQDAQELLGFDFTGYQNTVERSALNHIEKRHGENGTADNTMKDLNDVSRIGYVLDNYDTVELTTDADGNEKFSKQFRDKNNNPAPLLKYTKKINGTYYAVIACPDSKYKKLWLVSAYIQKNNSQVTQESDVNTPDSTPKTGLASPMAVTGASQLINANSPNATSKNGSAIAPTDSIPQSGTNVNKKIPTFLAQSAELAQMGENGVQLMQEVYDGSVAPEKFFEAYNAVYAAGRRGGEARGRYVSTLGDNVAKMVYNAGKMDALKASGKNSAQKVLQKDGGGGTIELTTADTPPRRKARTAEERQAAHERQIEAERRRVSQLSPESQKHLKDKYNQYRDVIEQLEVGDKLINDNGDIVGEVTSVSEDCIFIGGEGGVVERILSDTFTGDQVISMLDVGDGHFEKPDGTWIGGSKNNAIWRYKSSESYKINEAIRSGRELTAEESAFIEELDRDLEKTPKYSGVVYRNMTFDMQGQEALDNFVAGHTIGEIVTYPAYTSTSKTQEGYVVDGELLVHIEISGETGHDISKGYGIEEEQEVLFGRNTDFYVSSISYDGKTANIVLEEVTYGEGKISGSDKGYNSAQQGYDSESGTSKMQRMQASGQMDVQKVSQRNTERDSSQRSDLREIRGEVITDVNPDVQQAKETAIEPDRVVYSSKKAVAYDAISRDKLDAKQKKVVDVAAQIGRKVIFATTVNKYGVEVDGFIAENGDIYINPNKNVAPMAFVFKHELAHFAERAGQKYQDFKNLVRKSAAFKSWLKAKGLTEQQYNAQLRAERAAIGVPLDEPGATVEIISNFVGDMLFGDNNTISEDLIRELKPEQRKTVREYIRDFFSWIKSKFVGEAGKAKVEVRKLEKAFGAAYRAAVESNAVITEEQFAFNDSLGQQLRDWINGGGKKYGSYNGEYFELGTTPDILVKHGAKKVPVIMSDDCVAKVTGMKNDSGHNIAIDEIAKLPLQLNDPILLFKGNYPNSFVALTEIVDKQGHDVVVAIHINKFEKRTKITKIASLYSKTDDYGNNKIVRYVQNQINQGNLIDASITKASNWFTIRGLQLPKMVQTILDANNSIAQKSEKSTQNSKKISEKNLEDGGEQFSYTPQNDKVKDVFERIRSGELSLNDAEQLLKKPEGDTPATIANITKEKMGTTPHVNKKSNGNVGDGDSKFSESVKKSSVFNEDFKKEVGEDNFVKHYASITNKETLAEAAKRLDEGGEAYVNKWLSKKTTHMDTVDTMVGFILLKRYQDVGDYSSAAAVAQKVREVGTLSGQRVQAFSIIGRFDADMMQTYAQRELDKAWELAIEGRGERWLEKHKEQFKLTDEEISFIRDNILYAAKMPENSRERAIALAQITTLIQNKIPPVRGQAFKAWQRVSMLLNPKTQIRNVTGNLIAAPVFVASDWFSTPVDFLISKATGVRTTGLTGLHGTKANLKAAKKGIYESYDDWKRHINTKADELNRFEIGQGKSFDETKWGRIAEIMNGFDRFTSFLLEAGDRPFYEMWFTNSLNEQMRLNNVSEPTEAMVQIAVDEALSRTWQDDNLMTNMVSGIKNACNKMQIAGYGVGDVLIKFTKTPANLTKAIYDFSPAAIATLTPQAIRLTKAIKKGTATPSMQKKFVSNVGKMAAGTMLYVVFTALYAAGHITGSSDEDKDVAAFEKYIQGIPAYSIKIGDKWFSYDWAQPIGAVPAIIADFMESRKEGSGDTDSVLNAFKAGGEVLFNQSFMTSFQTLFSADSFSEGFLDIVLGEVTVPIPTAFSQLANVLDDKRRVTYDGTSETMSAIYRAVVKIPGLRNLLEAEVDVLGREVDNSQKNWFNAFFNPANTYTDTSTVVTDHAYEIYQSTGDVGAIPAKAPSSVKLQGKNIKLDAVQRAQYQRTMGETASDLIEILLENDAYKAMNDEEKLAVLKQVYSYSSAVAKDQLDWADDYEVISGIAPYITKNDFAAMAEEERYKIVSDYIFSDYEEMEDIESEIGQSNSIINKKTANLVLSATLIGDIDEAVELIEGIDDRVASYDWSEEDTEAEIKDIRCKRKEGIPWHPYITLASLYERNVKDKG